MEFKAFAGTAIGEDYIKTKIKGEIFPAYVLWNYIQTIGTLVKKGIYRTDLWMLEVKAAKEIISIEQNSFPIWD